MNPISVRVILLLFFTSLVAAVNFAQCLVDFKANQNATGGVDSHGRNVSAVDAVGLTYRTCTERCGTTSESFSWREFAQLFASWLLPWLALVNQLPFGSGNYLDDLVSVIMSVGSPALAAYSLMITSFNTRMVYQRANCITHEKKADVARALIALQQTPLELTKDERLLRSIPTDDKWIREILERLNKRNAWSLATGLSVAWAVIAFALTLVDSFVSLDDPSYSGLDGLAVGTLWLWLLCLVIGWLWVPIFPSNEVNIAIRRANFKAARSVAKKIITPTCKAVDRAKAEFQKRTHNPKPSKKSDTGPIIEVVDEVVDENENEKQESIHGGEKHAGGVAELRYNPFQSATSLHAPAESQQHHSHPSVGGIQSAHEGAVSVVGSAGAQQAAAFSVSSLLPGADQLLIPLPDVGWLHRDEFRHPATFNYSRFIRYRMLVEDVFRVLDRLDLADEQKRPLLQLAAPPPPEYTMFPPGVFATMFYAAGFALVLQCGVTGAAVVIMIFVPTVGLGCRSLGYITYGGLAIVIMFLTMLSTVLARISETRGDKSPFVKGVTAFFAISIRRICYFLALLNSVGLLLLCCFEFFNFFANCYCKSSIIGRGTNAYVVIFFQDWIYTIKNVRIIGIAAAAGSMSVFMISLWLISSLPADMNGV